MSEDLPWGLVQPLGRPVPDDVDPRRLPGVKSFRGYTVEENDLHVTVYARGRMWAPPWKQRLFVSEQPDAVHVVLVHVPRPPDPPPPPGVEEGGMMWSDEPTYFGAHVMLESPLGDRPVIDAKRDVAAKRLATAPGSRSGNRPLRRRRPRT